MSTNHILSGDSIDFSESNWQLSFTDDTEITVANTESGQSFTISVDGDIDIDGSIEAADGVSFGDDFVVAPSGDDIAIGSDGDAFVYTPNGELSVPVAFDWGEQSVSFSEVTVDDVSLDQSLVGPQGESLDTFDSLSFGAANYAIFSDFAKAIGEVQFEIGLDQLEFKGGVFDMFVDDSKYESIEDVVRDQSDLSVSLFDGDILVDTVAENSEQLEYNVASDEEVEDAILVFEGHDSQSDEERSYNELEDGSTIESDIAGTKETDITVTLSSAGTEVVDPSLSMAGDTVSFDGTLSDGEEHTDTISNVAPDSYTGDVSLTDGMLDLELSWTETTETVDPSVTIESSSGSQTIEYTGTIEDGETVTLSNEIDVSLIDGDVTVTVTVSDTVDGPIGNVRINHRKNPEEHGSLQYPNREYPFVPDEVVVVATDEIPDDSELRFVLVDENGDEITITPDQYDELIDMEEHQTFDLQPRVEFDRTEPRGESPILDEFSIYVTGSEPNSYFDAEITEVTES